MGNCRTKKRRQGLAEAVKAMVQVGHGISTKPELDDAQVRHEQNEFKAHASYLHKTLKSGLRSKLRAQQGRTFTLHNSKALEDK